MQNKILIALFIICVGAIAFCMIFLMERVETTHWTGKSEEARRNPYLAAEQFLAQREVSVVKTTDILDFNNIPTDQTVLLTQVDSMLVSPKQVAAAKRWIKAGGYMIVGVEDELQGQTSLLNEFDITREFISDDEDLFAFEDDEKSVADQMREMNRKIEEQQAKEEREAAEKEATEKQSQNTAENKPKSDEDRALEHWQSVYGRDQDHEFFTLSVTGGEQIHIAVLDSLVLDHWLIGAQDEEYEDLDYTLNTWVSDKNGPRLLQFYYGEGTLVAMSSSSLWQNNHISLGDHAYLLSYLVPEDSTLQLFYNIKSPPLRQLIFTYFGEMVWASLGFLALWLWYRGARTQRIRNQHNTGRRNFIEHLKASASYFVRQQHFKPLIDSLRLDIEQQLRSQHPNFSTLPEATKVAILSEKTNLSPAALQSWLAYCNHIDNREHFFSALQLGNAIRKQL